MNESVHPELMGMEPVEPGATPVAMPIKSAEELWAIAAIEEGAGFYPKASPEVARRIDEAVRAGRITFPPEIKP